MSRRRSAGTARKITVQRMQASPTNSAQLTLTRYAKAKALLRYAKRLRRKN